MIATSCSTNDSEMQTHLLMHGSTIQHFFFISKTFQNEPEEIIATVRVVLG